MILLFLPLPPAPVTPQKTLKHYDYFYHLFTRVHQRMSTRVANKDRAEAGFQDEHSSALHRLARLVTILSKLPHAYLTCEPHSQCSMQVVNDLYWTYTGTPASLTCLSYAGRIRSRLVRETDPPSQRSNDGLPERHIESLHDHAADPRRSLTYTSLAAA